MAVFAADFLALSSALLLRLVLAGVAACLFFNANGVLELYININDQSVIGIKVIESVNV